MPRYPKAQRDVYSGEDVAGYLTAPATPGGGSGTVTSVSVVTANGFSGSVSNPTTTPQITLQFNATSGQILVGNGSNIATPVTMSGDATITNAGVVSVNKTRLIVRNETGVTIPTTRAVIVTGFNNYPLIGLADNTNEAKHNVIGLTVGAIADQTNGYIATGGQCDAETNAWPVGTELYWTTNGNLTTTEPTSGEIKHIGIVTVKQNYPVGKILIYNQFEGSMRGAGAGVGLIDRLGDSAGATKWSLRNYANTEVAYIDSLGRLSVSSIVGGSLVSTYAGAGANGFNYWVGGGGLSSVGSPSTFNGSTNSAFGYQSCYQNTGGYDNTAMGYKALRANQAGYGNTAIGANAMLTSYGDGNTAVGSGAMTNIWLSSNSVAVGNGAMPGSGSSFTGNVAIGNNAFPILTSGSSNSLLGYNSGGGLTTGSNNTILGANVNGLAAGLTNNIILATGDGTIRARFDGTSWTFTPALTASAAWGGITGTLSSQTDLQTALNGKQATAANLTELANLATAFGFLKNDGGGAFSWGFPTAAQVGAMAAVANLTLTSPASAATLTLVGGSTLQTTGAFLLNLTTTAASTPTFPAGAGTLVYLGGTNTWSAAQTWSVNSTFTQGAIFTAYAGGTTAGQFWYDSTQKAMTTYADGLKQFTSTTMFVMTADGTNGAATAETSIIGTGVGTKTIPGSFFMAGKTIRVRGLGVFTTAATPGTVTLKLKLGSVVVATSAAVTPTASKTAAFFEFEFLLTCRTATTIQGGGALYMDAVVAQIGVPNTTTATIVNATAYAVDVTSTNSVASGCVWTTKVCTIEVMG